MAKVAFLGVGLIGAGLAEAAARRGDDVVVWNRSAGKARALAALGIGVAAAAQAAEAVVGAERVHLALKDDEAVDAVLAALEGALGAGSVVLDHTTTSPAGAARRAARMHAAGRAFLHAPVFMSPQNAREAKGIMLVAGPRGHLERVEADLRAMCASVEYVGERSDLAAAYKLFGNALIFALTAGLADVFAMAKSLGVPIADALAQASKFNASATFAYRGVRMAQGDYRPGFELDMARKDVGLMLDAAGGEQLTLLPAIAARMDALLARGLGREDLGALAIDTLPKAPG